MFCLMAKKPQFWKDWQEEVQCFKQRQTHTLLDYVTRTKACRGVPQLGWAQGFDKGAQMHKRNIRAEVGESLHYLEDELHMQHGERLLGILRRNKVFLKLEDVCDLQRVESSITGREVKAIARYMGAKPRQNVHQIFCNTKYFWRKHGFISEKPRAGQVRELDQGPEDDYRDFYGRWMEWWVAVLHLQDRWEGAGKRRGGCKG